MKSMPRRGVLALWLSTLLLLAFGIYAGSTAEGRPASQDTVAAPTAPPAVGPPQEPAGGATGVGSADAPQIQVPPPTAGQIARQARGEVDIPFYQRLLSLLGLVTMLLLAWLLSVDRRIVPWRIILIGTGLQILFALFILRTPVGERLFSWINTAVVALLGFTVQGASFLFGNLVFNNVPVGTGEPGNIPLELAPGMAANTGAFFAFNVLPTIIFFSSLMTVLYHLGVMQWVVKGFAWVMMRSMRTSGAETLSAAGNIFVGQTEAPLLIKPFVATMTMSELMAVMVGGFATVAGGVMAAYVGMLVAFFPDIAGHLLAASVMSAPAALVIAKVMYPEKEEPATRGTLRVEIESTDANVIDAAARGAGEGLMLALNVGAMLLAFIALVALANALLALAADTVGATALLQGWGALGAGQPLTLETILGWILAPLAWVMGVPWQDATVIGSLLGVKTVLNEFVAYLQLASLLSGGVELSPRSIVIATYALCGFANFSSIAIQIGGIGGIAPSRRSDLSRIGLRAMIGGTLAAFMTATVAGMLI
jgi:concentrative nucleoside transporter, CNT family